MTAEQMPAEVVHIVVGVDGSECAQQAALWAADEAALRGLPLTVVHALGVTEGIAPTLGPDIGQGQEPPEGERLLATTLHTLRERHPGLQATAQRSALAPAEQLTELSGPDTLVVIGTRGHGALVGMLLGSVSRALVKHTRGPLVVVRGPQAKARGGRVVLGIGSAPGQAAAHFAFDAAEHYRAPVHAVRTRAPLPVSPGVPGAIDLPVVMPAGGGIRASLPPGPEALRDAFEDAAEHDQALVQDAIGAARAAHPQVPVQIACTEGDAAMTLTANAEDACLVVLGAPCERHRGTFALTPGHVTAKLLAHCPAPVAIIPDAAAKTDTAGDDTGAAADGRTDR